jgi:hypothetical protein
MIIAFSSVETIELRLPSGDDNTSLLYISGYIRDTLYCVTELNLSSVVVISDLGQMNGLIDSLQNSNNGITNNPLVQMLASGNQNTVGQVISSLSQEFNKINNQIIQNAVTSN